MGAGHNRISGSIPPEALSFGSSKFQVLDVSWNDFEGPMPRDEPVPSVHTFMAEGNSKMSWGGNFTSPNASDVLPFYLVESQTFVIDPANPVFICPQLTGYKKYITITLDSSYYDYEVRHVLLCVCVSMCVIMCYEYARVYMYLISIFL
jgi:hypothetical protein